MTDVTADKHIIEPRNPKFDTRFFERYAKICLEIVLGNKYANLISYDRPDLQDVNASIGIEVTRAMEESKVAAIQMINDMAADDILPNKQYSSKELVKMGYSYGLVKSLYVAPAEYKYWSLAYPLKRIIRNKVEKVMNNFYGYFKEFGLFIFVKDVLLQRDILDSMSLIIELQSKSNIGFNYLFLYDAQFLYVCDIISFSYEKYCISDDLSNKFFRIAVSEDV